MLLVGRGLEVKSVKWTAFMFLDGVSPEEMEPNVMMGLGGRFDWRNAE